MTLATTNKLQLFINIDVFGKQMSYFKNTKELEVMVSLGKIQICLLIAAYCLICLCFNALYHKGKKCFLICVNISKAVVLFIR